MCQFGVHCWCLCKALSSSHCQGEGGDRSISNLSPRAARGNAHFWLRASLWTGLSQQWDWLLLPYTFQSVNFRDQSCFNLTSTPFSPKRYFYTTKKSSVGCVWCCFFFFLQEKYSYKTNLTHFGIPPAQTTYQTLQLNHQDIQYNLDKLQTFFFPFQDGAKQN